MSFSRRMRLQNRIRNMQLFGINGYKPKKSHLLVLGIVVVGLFLLIAQLFPSDSEKTPITGLAVGQGIQGNTDTQAPQGGTDTTANQEQTTVEEVIPEEDEEEELEYYEYKEQCAYNIKKTEDDIKDVLAYIDRDRDLYQSIEEEYEAELRILEERYFPRLEDAKREYDEAQQILKDSQDELVELQEQCAY